MLLSLCVTFQAEKQLVGVGFATGFTAAVDARKGGRSAGRFLENDRVVFVEDLRIREYGHDFGCQNRCIGLDLTVVFLVDFAGTAMRFCET